jgi:hypothetical protein
MTAPESWFRRSYAHLWELPPPLSPRPLPLSLFVLAAAVIGAVAFAELR